MNKVGRIDPACRPPKSQPIPHKPGKVVVQKVVYLPSSLAYKPVFAGILKAGSEDTLSVFRRSHADRRSPTSFAAVGLWLEGCARVEVLGLRNVPSASDQPFHGALRSAGQSPIGLNSCSSARLRRSSHPTTICG